MKFPILLIALGGLVASPAFAWSGSTQAGAYRLTATLDDSRHLQSVALAPQPGVTAGPMRLHAWFVDGDGAILGEAPLGPTGPSGLTPIAAGNTAVPSAATALVVMAQPAGLTRIAAAAQPAIVAQIALR